MKRLLSIFLTLIFVIVISTGCDTDSKTTKGITTIGGHTCYQVDLDGNTATRYFTLSKPKGQVCISLNGQDHPGSAGVVVNYAKVDQGGWIAYLNDLLIYLPKEASETNAQIACASFSSLTAQDCLTIEEAGEYLPFF